MLDGLSSSENFGSDAHLPPLSTRNVHSNIKQQYRSPFPIIEPLSFPLIDEDHV